MVDRVQYMYGQIIADRDIILISDNLLSEL